MRIEEMSLTEALSRAHTKNPKEHDIDGLIGSFVRFGFKAAPTIDETSGVMVAGHGRCLALAEMRKRLMPAPAGVRGDGVDWFLPVVRGVDFESDEQRDAYVIADNQHVIAGGWNLDALTEMLGSLDSYEGLGFEEAELSAFGIGSTIGSDEQSDELPGPHAASDDANEHGGKESTVREHTRKPTSTALIYKVTITCLDEHHQAALLKRFEEEGLTCAPLIV